MTDAQLKSIYNAYSSGQMTPEESAQYEADINQGLISLPSGATLKPQSVSQAPEEQTPTQQTAPIGQAAPTATPTATDQQTDQVALPENVFNAYFNGQMTPEEQDQLSMDAANKMIALPEGITVESYHDPMEGTKYKLSKERTWGERAIGGLEAGAQAATGFFAGTPSWIGGTLKGIFDAANSQYEYGTKEWADMVVKSAEDAMQQVTVQPKTEAGQEYSQALAEAGAPLMALTPLAGEISAATKAATPYLKTKMGMQSAFEPPKTISPQAEAVQAAKQVGIKTMTSDVRTPRNFVTKWMQTTGERIPLAGTGGAREAQQVQRINAVRDVMRQFGAEDAAQVSDDVMRDLSRTRSTQLTKYSSMKKDVIGRLSDKGSVPVENATNAIDNQISKLQKMNTEKVNPLIGRLEDFKTAIQNQDIGTLEELRKVLGDSMGEQDMIAARSLGEKASSNIYGALKEDFGKFIKENGERRDLNKWQIANKQLSNMMGEVKTGALKSTLKRGDATPEAVRSMLFSKKPSEIRTLYKNLSPEGRKNAQMALLHEALEKSGGIDNISPDKFLNNLNKLSKQTDIFFTGEDKKVVNGLSKALSITKRAGEFSANPPTGVQLSIPIGAAVLADVMGGAGAATATGATVGLAARAFESAAVRNALIALSDAKLGSVAEQNAVNALLLGALTSQEEKE